MVLCTPSGECQKKLNRGNPDVKSSPACIASSKRNLPLSKQKYETCNALFHPLVECSKVGNLIIDTLRLHVVTEEQTANVVFLHLAALRQVSKNLVDAHFVATLTHVTDVSKELLSVDPCRHISQINNSSDSEIINSFMKL